MSRASLVRHAKARHIPLVVTKGKVSYPKSIDDLRIELMESFYGPNLGVIKGTAPDIDARIDWAAKTHDGKCGPDLLRSQLCILLANKDRAEAKRLSEERVKDSAAISALLNSARQYLVLANVALNLHGIAVGLRGYPPVDYRPSPFTLEDI
ncbi:hypothetical protein [Burkholderia sp. PAMC 28687]|uniref:hypothetical protein n=1 Tax=Burkholderia sp. PAMC 28687 TaxID=1795874 RepID=UPI0012D76031|nr:hypothetical protein [Burkholderia sp. PAMC 28687]